MRHDYTLAEIRRIHDLPLTELVFRAQTVHREHHPPDSVQLCTLLSVKTGGCPEDCSYCPQSSVHDAMDAERFLSVEEVVGTARRAREAGATRFCMGAAWREVKDGPAFDRVLAMVRGVRDLGLEACATLGMLDDDQARRLADAGLSAYNHNLDTSRAFYGNIIQSRTYDDRLATLQRVRKAGISVCCGGIIGMGENLIAEQMLRFAEKYNVPVVRNIRLAHKLWDEGEVYEFVPEETYEAVAEILRWITALNTEKEYEYQESDLD